MNAIEIEKKRALRQRYVHRQNGSENSSEKGEREAKVEWINRGKRLIAFYLKCKIDVEFFHVHTSIKN